MLNINVFTTLYKRPLVTEICFLGLDRIRDAYADRINFRVFAIGEQSDFMALCEKYDITFIKNEPEENLGDKIQGVVRYSMQSEPDFDYLMKLDTDDLITSKMLDQWEGLMNRGIPAFGSVDKYVVNVITKEAKYFKGYPNTKMSVSGGKMIRGDIVKQMDGRICKPFLNQGIDYSIKLQLAKQEVEERLLRTCGNIELKSPVNIHGFDDLEGESVGLDKITDELSYKEEMMIKYFEIFEGYRRGLDDPYSGVRNHLP